MLQQPIFGGKKITSNLSNFGMCYEILSSSDPVASQQDLCGSVTTWSLITPDAQVAKLAKGLVSQR